MKQSRLEAFAFLKPSIKSNPHLHTARLLSPRDAEIAFNDFPEDGLAKVRGYWMLVGAVNKAMYARLRAYGDEPISALLTGFQTPSGAAYAAMCCQIGGSQHRFLLPLYSAEVVKFLRASPDKPLNINLECAGEPNGSMLYNCSLQPDHYISALIVSQMIDQTRFSSFSAELPSAISTATAVDFVPSLNGQAVRDVDVSVLLPLDARQPTGDEGRTSFERSPYRH